MTGTDSIYSTELYKAFPIGKKFQFRERGTSTDYQIKSYYFMTRETPFLSH